MKNTQMYLVLALMTLLALMACEELPDSDPGALEHAVVVAMLEPGDYGRQEVLLSKPVDLGLAVSDSSTFISGADLVIRNLESGAEGRLVEDAAAWRYVFSRDTFPLVSGERIELELSGEWNGQPFSGAAMTTIVSDEGLAFTERPRDTSHGYPADTLMFHREELEEGFTNPEAFDLAWEQGPVDVQYQVEFLAVSQNEQTWEWEKLPPERMQWLRDDEEAGFQVGPYPDLRLPPGANVPRQPISWGFFVFVDSLNTWAGDDRDRQMGYYRVTLRRMNNELASFLYSTHWWIREEATFPVNWNLEGERLKGIVGSSASSSFRVAIVEE
jgi:hypothetical protein